MALKVKAVERNIKFTKDENDPGVWRYVMQPELYIVCTRFLSPRAYEENRKGLPRKAAPLFVMCI